MSLDCTITNQTSDCCDLLTGIGAPTSTLGNNGSVYVSETSPYYWYVKKNGTWKTIGYLKGADGVSGSNQILLNDFTHSTLTGALVASDVFSYSLDVTNLAANGDVIRVFALLAATNNSTYANPVQIRWSFDSSSINNNYLLYNPSQLHYLLYEILLSRDSESGSNNIKVYTNMTTKYGTANGENVENGLIAITKSLAAPNTYDLKLKATATDATIVPIQLLVMKYKMI